MLVSVGPVGWRVAVIVTLVEVNVFGNKALYEINMTLTSSDMQAGEAARILDLRVTTLQDELSNRVTHVPLRGEVHGRVSSYIVGILGVRLRACLQQNVDDRHVLVHDRVLEQHIEKLSKNFKLL